MILLIAFPNNQLTVPITYENESRQRVQHSTRSCARMPTDKTGLHFFLSKSLSFSLQMRVAASPFCLNKMENGAHPHIINRCNRYPNLLRRSAGGFLCVVTYPRRKRRQEGPYVVLRAARAAFRQHLRISETRSG